MRGRLLLLLVLLLARPGAASADDGEVAATLRVASWRLATLLGGASGTACWLSLVPAEQWRVEIVRDDGPGSGDRAAALARRGEGWTAFAPGDGSAYLQPWGGAIRRLDARETRRVNFLLAAASQSGPLDPGALAAAGDGAAVAPETASREDAHRLPWRTARPEPPTLDVVWDDAGGTPRRRSETRGLGRGDGRERWRITRRPDGGTVIADVSRGGVLSLAPPEVESVGCDPSEALAPLWPLGEVIEGKELP